MDNSVLQAIDQLRHHLNTSLLFASIAHSVQTLLIIHLVWRKHV